MTSFRTDYKGETVYLDKDARKLEAAVRAVAAEEGFRYDGEWLTAEAERNPRVAKWVMTAQAAVNAYRKAR